MLVSQYRAITSRTVYNYSLVKLLSASARYSAEILHSYARTFAQDHIINLVCTVSDPFPQINIRRNRLLRVLYWFILVIIWWNLQNRKYSNQLSEQNASSVLAYLGDHLWHRNKPFHVIDDILHMIQCFWESMTTLPLPSSKQNVPNSEETSCLLTISSLRVQFWSACSAVALMHFDMAPQPVLTVSEIRYLDTGGYKKMSTPKWSQYGIAMWCDIMDVQIIHEIFSTCICSGYFSSSIYILVSY